MVDFTNIKQAFSDKSNRDLNRAFVLFKTISNPKISSILTPLVKLALLFRLPISYFIRNTIYKHFCGGETIDDSQKTINKLWKSSIGTILDYSAEGKKSEEDFNKVLKETLQVIKESENNKKIPFIVFKVTGLIQFSILEKLNTNEKLNNIAQNKFNAFLNKISIICNAAKESNTPVLIDAEESWIQDAIDNIVLNLMREYNKEHVMIYNTLQFYRVDRIKYLNKLLEISREENFKLGLKLVRGAYHQQEIERAKQRKYPIPVHLKKEMTDKDFNLSLEICIDNINRVSICSGTHNEESSAFLLQLMKEKEIENNDKRICSSQLLGMSDNISYNLSAENYNVSKYVPYGPVREVIPYLIRRAEENKSISGQMSRELKNIVKEKNRRKNN